MSHLDIFLRLCDSAYKQVVNNFTGVHVKCDVNSHVCMHTDASI